MMGIMSNTIKKLKRPLNGKGQGIVEFALLCAFCAAIGLFARDAGFSEAFNEALDKSKPELYSAAIGMRPRNGYMYYFNQWSTMQSGDLGSMDNNNERIEADQKALVKLAEAYLGKTIEEIAEQGEELSGDDYYEEHKAEWNKAGLTNMEKHDKVKEFKDVYKKDDEPFGKSTLWDDDMRDF